MCKPDSRRTFWKGSYQHRLFYIASITFCVVDLHAVFVVISDVAGCGPASFTKSVGSEAAIQ